MAQLTADQTSFAPTTINAGGSSVYTVRLSTDFFSIYGAQGVTFTVGFPEVHILVGGGTTNRCGGVLTTTVTGVSLQGGGVGRQSSCELSIPVFGTAARTTTVTTPGFEVAFSYCIGLPPISCSFGTFPAPSADLTILGGARPVIEDVLTLWPYALAVLMLALAFAGWWQSSRRRA